MKPIPIIVFAKAAVAGQVKTRLIPAKGRFGATVLYKRMVAKTIATATSCHIGPVMIYAAPHKNHPFFRRIAHRYGLRVYNQRGKDLGERMFDAFAHALRYYDGAIIIGCDCPDLTPCKLARVAFALQNGDEAVFIRAMDGGYVLVGLRKAIGELFQNIPWGSPNVMSVTEDILKVRSIGYTLLPPLRDIDKPEDLKCLALPASGGE